MSKFGWMLLTLFGLCLPANAQNLKNIKLLEMEEFSWEIYKYEHLRDSYLYPDDQSIIYGTAFNADLNLLRVREVFRVYWNNRVHTEAVHKAVKLVGWHWELGLNFNNRVEIYWEHHSQHVMEAVREHKFPVYDRYGLRFTFYERRKR